MIPTSELSVSLAGLAREDGHPWSAGARAAIEWAAASGFRWVAIDGTQPGLRAREMDRSARRDLGAMLRRLRLGLSGVELWIPPEHFSDPGNTERAVAAAASAIEMAADVARLAESRPPPVLSLLLPPAMPRTALDEIAVKSETCGVPVADHARPPSRGVRIGIDVGAALMAGEDPGAAVLQAGADLASVRLADASPTGRVAVGAPGGRLDLLTLKVSLTTAGYARPVVLDLRGLTNQAGAAARGAEAWAGSVL